MPTFAENFLRAYAVGTESKARQERLRLEEEQQALQRQQFITQMQRAEEDRKTAAITRQQQDALLKLKLFENVDRPTIPAGDGVGPPAPAEVQPLSFPLHGGGNMKVTPLFRGDILEAERAKKEMANDEQLDFEVRKATALGPIQAELERAKGSITLPPGLGKPLGLPEGVALPKEVVNTAETIFSQRQANARNAADIAARADAKDADALTPQSIRYMADQVLKRNLDVGTVTKKTQEAILSDLGSRGLNAPRQLTAKQKDFSGKAQAALSALDTMESLYKENPRVLEAASVPTNIGRRISGAATGSNAQRFETARARVRELDVREASGAQINENEYGVYEQFDAKLGDTPAEVEYKFDQKRALYAGLAGVPVHITMPDGKEFTVQDGYDPASRAKMRHAIEHGGKIDLLY